MASKTSNDFTYLYEKLNSGVITYEEFLNFTDPKNPNGIYGNILNKIDKIISSQEFANIDKKTQAAILNERKQILTGGDSSILGIEDNLGLNPASLKNHRLFLKQGLKPVLDLTEASNKEDIAGLPFTFVSDQELANKNSNEYFSFRVYNEKGVPSEITVKGTKLDDPDDPEAIKYIYSVPQYGNISIDKSNPEDLVIQGLDGNGDEADKKNGVLNLYSENLKPVIKETQKNIRNLKTIYGQSSVAAGDPWTEQDDKQFDKWAYSEMRKGKEFKDLENQIYDSPALSLQKARREKMFQAPGMDGTPAPTLEGPVPQGPIQGVPMGAAPMAAPISPGSTGSINTLPNAALQGGGQAIPSLGPTLNLAVQEAQKATNFQNPMAGAYLFQKNLKGAIGR